MDQRDKYKMEGKGSTIDCFYIIQGGTQEEIHN